jgi:hypothetical protein
MLIKVPSKLLGSVVVGLLVTLFACEPTDKPGSEGPTWDQLFQPQQKAMVDNGTAPAKISGMQRNADGSFTQTNYSATGLNITQLASQANAQADFLKNLPARPPAEPLPAGWKPGGDPLLGRGSTPLAFGDLLNNGTSIGYCTFACGSFSGSTLLTVRRNAALNVTGTTQTTVSGSSLARLIAADMNGDGRRDAVVASITGSTSGRVLVYPLNADGTLASPLATDIPALPRNVAAYDLNGDGKLDVVTGNDGGYSVLLGNGNGTFQAPLTISLINVISGSSVALGDVNGDGKADLVLGSIDVLNVAMGNGNGTFQLSRAFPVQGSLEYVAIADVNKDGKPDLLASDNTGATITILQGDGVGNFTMSGRYVTGEANDSFFVMDFDLDGNPDLVFAHGHPDMLWPNMNTGRVAVIFGRGDGTFYSPSAFAVGGGVGVIADFNNDGHPDWAGANRTYGVPLPLLLGQGGTGFRAAPVTIPDSQVLGPVAAGDFNGDGKADLVVSESSLNKYYFLAGKGDGTFQAPVVFAGAFAAIYLTAGDLNGDGRPDLAYTDGDTQLAVQLGNGAGGFASPVKYTAGPLVGAVQIGDMNGDGRADLLVTDRGTPAVVAIYTGRGDGTFNNPVTYPANTTATSTVIADINGDGRPDFVVAAAKVSGVTYTYQLLPYLNQGGGTFTALAPVATASNPQDIAFADFNGDGKGDLVVSHCCGRSPLTMLRGNGDGTFQAELWALYGRGEGQVRAVDLNGDGLPDIMAQHTADVMVSLNRGVMNSGTPVTLSGGGATPAAGSASSQSMQFTFTDPNGWQDLDVVNILINNFLDGRNACYLAYSRPAGVIYLVGDNGGGLSAPLTLGGSGSISNSQCTVNAAGSSATGSGNTLTLVLNMSFNPSFAGNKVTYLAARSTTANSGWSALGTWGVPPLPSTGASVGGVSPAHTTGSGAIIYTFTFNDSNGAADIGVVNVLINSALDGGNACYLAYSRAANTVYLVNDPGTALVPGGVTPGESGSVSNSQCTINGAGSSMTLVGNSLTLNLNMTFPSTFGGNRIIYMATRSNGDALNSGWQAVGSRTNQ